jgi:aspartyl-tRNA(Asn)/glutamyl-tRNA(Gln) amidotransferase subunit B
MPIDGGIKPVRIRRVHLEEDTGKLIHTAQGTSLVDFNRCGVPLMEIVAEPDIESAQEARAYYAKLHSLLQYLGVSTGSMEEGSLRCEPTSWEQKSN